MFFFLGIFVIWFIVWKLFFEKLLYSCDVSSFWYGLYELGPFGTFGAILFLGVLIVLFIASIQFAIDVGIKMIFPLILFWGSVITIGIAIIKRLRKK